MYCIEICKLQFEFHLVLIIFAFRIGQIKLNGHTNTYTQMADKNKT